MSPTNQRLLLGYGAFCLINAGIGYFWARKFTPGQNALADLNTKLLPFNLLARLVRQTDPNALAVAAPPAQQSFLPGAAPVVTDTSSGTTTYYGG